LDNRRLINLMRIGLVLLLCAFILVGPGLWKLVEQWWLPFIGVAGALVANSTGIGGGVVFVPAFDAIGLEQGRIVGTSLMIQAFGMTMGALTFLVRRTPDARNPAEVYTLLVAICVLPSLLGAYLSTTGGFRPDLPLKTIYKAISLFLVALIVIASLAGQTGNGMFRKRVDGPVLIGLSILGGMFVGWTSIGVGELVGVYLLLRGFRAADAVGIAVIVTALTVLGLQALHFPGVPADATVALFVVVGALPGAFLAPRLLERVGASRMKWFCAVWIVLSVLAT
jgi:uncharacterized membrane protein YfcA